ncbi:MAG TPA: hypothetical protein VH184_14800 [Dongiaceae bacterium]|jgi:hypothetical protein|nr:hypothetical protein [Dongiaceae bacterium]
MFNGSFRKLPPAIAGFMVLAICTASIPAASYATGGEGRDSHDRADRSKDTGNEKKNPKPPADLFDEKRF